MNHADGNNKDGGAWTMFLMMAFAVIGFVAVFAVHQAGLPFELAVARSLTLDRALALSAEPDAAARLEALRPSLGDSAAHILTGAADMPTRIAAERARMLASFGAQSASMGAALRIDVAATVAAGALFGAAAISIVRRARRQP